MAHKLFTLDEALALLPRLTTLLTTLKERSEALQARDHELSVRYQRRVRANGHAHPDRTLAELEGSRANDAAALRELVEELQAQGVELKDVATGLVDFPALRDGREVYLCWRLGEPTIAWWHELDTGFAGRQPL